MLVTESVKPVAAACGGTAERGAAGLELGVVAVNPLPAAADDPFLARIEPSAQASAWSVHQYHYDAVTRLPADAELMVTGDRYPHQGFRVGPMAWGLQYHPEVPTGVFVDWVERGVAKGELPPGAADVLGPVRAGSQQQTRVGENHARAFLDVVRARRSVPAERP